MSDKHTEFRYQKDKYHTILADGDMVIFSAHTGPEIGCVIGFTAKQVRVLKMISLKHAQEYDMNTLAIDPKKGQLMYSKTIIKINVDFM